MADFFPPPFGISSLQYSLVIIIQVSFIEERRGGECECELNERLTLLKI